MIGTYKVFKLVLKYLSMGWHDVFVGNKIPTTKFYIKCNDDKDFCYLALSTMKKNLSRNPKYRIIDVHETDEVKADSVLAKYASGADFIVDAKVSGDAGVAKFKEDLDLQSRNRLRLL